MKKLYAISSKGKTLKSFLDVRFGRCESIVIYDPVKKDHAIMDNPFREADHAGIKLVNFLEKNGVTAIITGEVGPMVQDKLEKDKIQLILLEEERIKIEEVISRIKVPK
ncbi:MAG: NifB/NifX family molybdenum-iron cluster-binding protein [Prolixibacteraceae bacterium]|nr:NifB/NifX family molybdenum-iron cluster-binding protein [Prolixibacteraceae bacterium]